MDETTREGALPAALTEVSFRSDAEAIKLYAQITADFNPLHVDAAFAATTPFGRPIAHGTMGLNVVWMAVAATFPQGCQMLDADIRFTKPVLEGQLVTAGGRLVDPQSGIYEVALRTDSGDVVLSGTVQVSTLR